LSQILKFHYDLSLALEMSEDWRAFPKTRINHGGFGKAVTRIGKKNITSRNWPELDAHGQLKLAPIEEGMVGSEVGILYR